jgi:hypothetical protein
LPSSGADLVRRLTDAATDDATACRQRAPDDVYPAVVLSGLALAIRTGDNQDENLRDHPARLANDVEDRLPA